MMDVRGDNAHNSMINGSAASLLRLYKDIESTRQAHFCQ